MYRRPTYPVAAESRQLDRLRPFPGAHERLDRAARQHAVDVEIAGSNHEVDVNAAAIAAPVLEGAAFHRRAAAHGNFVARPGRGGAGGFRAERGFEEQRA